METSKDDKYSNFKKKSSRLCKIVEKQLLNVSVLGEVLSVNTGCKAVFVVIPWQCDW